MRSKKEYEKIKKELTKRGLKLQNWSNGRRRVYKVVGRKKELTRGLYFNELKAWADGFVKAKKRR